MLINIFLRLLEVSISTSFIILPLCLFSRRLNRRYESKWILFIWIALALRLLIPINLPSIYEISILPDLTPQHYVQTQDSLQAGSDKANLEDQMGSTREKLGKVAESEYPDQNKSQLIETEATMMLNWTEIAAILWCVGVCCFCCFHLILYAVFRCKLLKNGTKLKNNLINSRITAISGELGLQKRIHVIVSDKSSSPMMVGIIRPVFVIPRKDYFHDEFDMIARHELTHCKRKDILLKTLLTAVNALHWFNPLVYLMVRESNANIELCCDADVLRNADSIQRKLYAESILSSMEREKGPVPVSTCFSRGDINKMKERFENIIHSGKRKTGIVLLMLIVVMSVLLGMFVSCENNLHSQDGASVSDSSSKDSQNIMPIVQTAGLELVDIEKIPDIPYPEEGDYLTLHEAIYALNYARSCIHADAMELPEEQRAESVYLYTYSDCTPSECRFFGNGVLCKEWKENHWHLPFHSTDDAFIKSLNHPAWSVTVKPDSEVEGYTETIWIDARTGDMYNDTNSGGYYPSPYLDRSEYARILHDEETQKNATSTTKTTATQKTTVVSSVKKEISDQELVTIRDYIPNIYTDVKYATTDNFTGQVIYDFSEPSLRYGTVKKLMKVQKDLNKLGYILKVWDAYRPIEAQLKLWEICPDPAYVSDPSKGYSGHCRGNTIDVTLVTIDGKELEMPSGYDDFSAFADRDYSDVSSAAAKNAELLEGMMKKHGFKGYQAEWWHYTDTIDYEVVK